MGRSLKIQEFFIQIVVIYFSIFCLQKLSFRPAINWYIGAIGFLVLLAALVLHLGNWQTGDKYFQPQKISQTTELWRFFFKFLMVVVGLYFLSFIPMLRPLMGLFIVLWPLLLLYPVGYYIRHQWYPRAGLLLGLILMSYSQFAFTKNDRLHLQLQIVRQQPQDFRPQMIGEFDKPTLTPYQANEVAWFLITHPNEELRNYEKAAEFAAIGLAREKHPLFAKNIADTLTCAYLGKKDKVKAQFLIEKYELTSRMALLANGELCDAPIRQRAPASLRKKKYKYYF